MSERGAVSRDRSPFAFRDTENRIDRIYRIISLKGSLPARGVTMFRLKQVTPG